MTITSTQGLDQATTIDLDDAHSQPPGSEGHGNGIASHPYLTEPTQRPSLGSNPRRAMTNTISLSDALTDALTDATASKTSPRSVIGTSDNTASLRFRSLKTASMGQAAIRLRSGRGAAFAFGGAMLILCQVAIGLPVQACERHLQGHQGIQSSTGANGPSEQR